MNIEDDILIERFLRGSLSEDAAAAVLERIKTDAKFKEKVILERELLETLNEDDWHFLESYDNEEVNAYVSILRSKELTELKQELRRANNTHKHSNVEPTTNWKRFVLSSAAILLIMVSAYWFINGSKSPKELYSSYIDTSDLPSLVSRDSDNNSLGDAQRLFEERQFEFALKVFDSALVVVNYTDARLLLYKGISEMELDRFNQAEQTFDTLINSNLLDGQKGFWFKALLMLKQEKVDETKALLLRIIANQYYKFEEAGELLKKIE